MRAAPEAHGCLVGLTWRADPAAVAAIAPWETLWRLVRAGAAPRPRRCRAGPVPRGPRVAGLRDARL